MNKRLEHEGVRNRYAKEIQTHTGPIPPGVGFSGRTGGGVINRIDPTNYTRVNGVLTYYENHIQLGSQGLPPTNMVAIVFDKNKDYLGEAEHLGFLEWYIDGDLVPEVEFYIPV